MKKNKWKRHGQKRRQSRQIKDTGAVMYYVNHRKKKKKEKKAKKDASRTALFAVYVFTSIVT